MNQPIDGRKVFGIGLNKTGTTSLGEALNALGIKTIHYPFKKDIFHELTQGIYRLSILNSYQGIVDTPVAPYYAQLDREYPGSKFILTLREPESWLRSIEAHWPVMRQWCERDPQFGRFTDFISAAVYGCIGFHRDRFLYAYETHERNARDYFRDRPEDFLVLDICQNQGWEPICDFLGLMVPERPFPHSNRGKDRGKAREWIKQFDLARGDLAQILYPEDRAILIDDGKVGEYVVPGAVAIPFPQQNGVYAGPPASDESALSDLKQLIAQGAKFVVFTWAAFWWFEHYPRLHRYLQDRNRCVLKNERVVVYELTA